MKKYYLSWNDFFEHLDQVFLNQHSVTIYGVPKGGMIVAGFLVERRTDLKLTHDPGKADIIIDDIYDTGKTAELYKKNYPNTPFVPFINRNDFSGRWIVFPWEADHPAGEESVHNNITRILEYIGEDPGREGLKETPGRVVKSWNQLFDGYEKDPTDVLTTFQAGSYDQMVLLKDIEIYSMCEHHMLPFFGRAHVAYIPNDKVIGISKLARLVEVYARRLQIQERIGEQVTKALMEHLSPKGAACIIEAQHLCMCARGVEKQHSKMTTSSMKGAFLEDGVARQEFMSLIR